MSGKFVNRFLWHIKELVKTFSHQESFYSSKRIERAIIFVNANVMLDICTSYLLHENKLDWTGLVAIYSAQMIYAGYTTKQIVKDLKKTNGEPEQPTV